MWGNRSTDHSMYLLLLPLAHLGVYCQCILFCTNMANKIIIIILIIMFVGFFISTWCTAMMYTAPY